MGDERQLSGEEAKQLGRRMIWRRVEDSCECYEGVVEGSPRIMGLTYHRRIGNFDEEYIAKFSVEEDLRKAPIVSLSGHKGETAYDIFDDARGRALPIASYRNSPVVIERAIVRVREIIAQTEEALL